MASNNKDVFSVFSATLDSLLAPAVKAVAEPVTIAVALSGGGDSMALCHMAGRWARARTDQGVPTCIHALTVDHGLRGDSAAEAANVARFVHNFECVTHHILTLEWPDGRPTTKIMEQARARRYAAMTAFCQARGITVLMPAHHRDDQAETFLFRLAKGSGLDGLAAMRPVQAHEGTDVNIVRPLLSVSHADLIAYCKEQGLSWVEDPTNCEETYSRNRIRGARDVLEAEGLTSKRLHQTSLRMARAVRALDVYAQAALEAAWMDGQGASGGGVERSASVCLDWARVRQEPHDIILRVILAAYGRVAPARDYRPRMERLESLTDRMMNDPSFNAACLGGCVFTLRRSKTSITLDIRREEATCP